MPTEDNHFEVDPKSVRDAESLIGTLRGELKYLLESSADQGWEESAPRVIKFASDILHLITEKIPQVPLKDVAIDTQDFGVLASLLRQSNLKFPARRMGGNGTPVPILPPIGFLPFLFSPNRPFAEFLFERLMTAPDRNNLTTLDVEEAQETFLTGLSYFLALRIAGVRSAREQGGGQSINRGGPVRFHSGGGPPPPLSGTSGSAQLWTVHTNGSGLSLYYGGTHAIRTTGIYVNAATTPLDVFLPMGTLYLAADAGPGGTLVWDDKKGYLRIPSYTPVYKTKEF